MPTVSIADEEIYYIERGQGRPLVFLHGAGSSHLIWGAQVNALAPHARVIAPDLPGHNKSSGAGHNTISGYADVVAQFLDELAIREAILVGHSMGGAIAESFALAHPDRVAALGLVATGARLRVLPALLDGFRNDFDQTIAKIIALYFDPNADARMIKKSAELLHACGQSVVLGDFSACDQFDVRERLAEIQAPTLVVCGAADQLTPPKFSELLTAKIPGAQLVLVERAGHHVMIEKPETVNRALEEFLAKVRS
jgi:pimeloyl-ACP methyl ester carboxylesterase